MSHPAGVVEHTADTSSYDRTGDVRMTSSHIVGLVARREILTRLKDKGFIVSSIFIIVLIMGSVVFQVLIQSGASSVSVGITDGPQDFSTAIEEQADVLGLDAEVTEYDDESAAREAVQSEEIDAAVVDGNSVLVNESLDDALGAAISGAINGLTLAQRLTDEGVNPDILQPVSLEVMSLQPAADAADEKGLVAFVSILLLYTLLIFFGQFIAQGVVEEKASRVIEVLLAAVKPWQLLAGKIIGLGVLAFAQLLIICAAGLGGAIAFDVITVPGAAIATVVQVLGWFVLGFTLVAALFAVCGALVSRQEDLQTVLLPMTLILVAALVLAITAGQNPNGTLAKVTSFVPALSTMVMPVRVATGSVAWWEIVLTVVLMLATIVAVVRIGGRIYSGALLGKGGRVKVRDALAAERVS
ncbi:MAG: ABC transporter permease [Actinomycetota bacterium]|nr:ABC transporter permease [Actinomycetota bacterium]